jgi:uncharacterized protein (UPF0303 family)
MRQEAKVDIEDDIQRISEQERRLVCAQFDLERAWQLGSRLRDIALARDLPLTIEIRLARETVFFCAMPGVTPANADWARRKRNTVELLHRSSYGVGRALEHGGQTLLETMGLATRDYASHGGSFPVQVKHAGCIGAATVSGAPQRVDHDIVVIALAELCGVPIDEIALK